MRSLNFRRFLGSFGTGAWLWVFTFVSAVQALTYMFCCQESALWWTETKEKINRLSLSLSWLHAWTTNRTGLAALPNAGPTSAPLHGPLPISNQSTCRSFSHCQGFVTITPLLIFKLQPFFAARKWFRCQMDKLLSQRTKLFSAIYRRPKAYNM